MTEALAVGGGTAEPAVAPAKHPETCDEMRTFPFRHRALRYRPMRKSLAPLIAAALSGALTVVVAMALTAANASSTGAMEATARLGVVAQAFLEGAASKGSDRLEVAPVGAKRAAQAAVADVSPALPAPATVLEVADSCFFGWLSEPTPARLVARAAPLVRRARGPPARG